MKNLLPLLLLLTTACPAPPECSDTKECAPGFVCQAGLCTPGGTDGGGSTTTCKGDALPGAPNLLDNPGFECSEPLHGWFAQFGEVTAESTTVRSGNGAARLTAPNAAAVVSLWHQADVVTDPQNRTYCANAYVRGTAHDARITIRRSPSNVDETFSSPVSATDWTLIPPASYGGVKAVAAGDNKLLFRVWIPNAKAGDFLLVDDVQFWESTDGGCKQR